MSCTCVVANAHKFNASYNHPHTRQIVDILMFIVCCFRVPTREEHVLLVALQNLTTRWKADSFGHILGEPLLFSCTFAWPPSWEKMECQEGTNLLEMAMVGFLFRVCRAWSRMEHDEQFGSRKIDTTGEFSLSKHDQYDDMFHYL